ncbi:MAG: peroxiredoxin [Inquilinus sp.]|nr:peroxiredoxin [Inquilinus sp.]
MAIKVGDKVPSMTLKYLAADGMAEADTDEIFGGKTVVLFSVPGAYTPTCTAQHLPGFISKADALKAKGVDDIVCLAVNDPFVMKAWGEACGVKGEVMMLPDWDAALSRAMGLSFDASGAGLGERGQRFAMVVKDGTVTHLAVEEGTGLDVSSAERVLAAL